MVKYFYLHVCCVKTQYNTTYKSDYLIKLPHNQNMPWLRKELKKKMEKDFCVSLLSSPVIQSITEMSEELFNTLTQNKGE